MMTDNKLIDNLIDLMQDKFGPTRFDKEMEAYLTDRLSAYLEAWHKDIREAALDAIRFVADDVIREIKKI